jgi:predicted nucleic acid-binding Zn ribbon protein
MISPRRNARSVKRKPAASSIPRPIIFKGSGFYVTDHSTSNPASAKPESNKQEEKKPEAKKPEEKKTEAKKSPEKSA